MDEEVMQSNLLELCDTRKMSFDRVVRAMNATGRDMSDLYKETSEGGLAVHGVRSDF